MNVQRVNLRRYARKNRESRGSLGIMEPTIDLNTCALDALKRVPKLSKDVAKQIMLFESNTKHQQFINLEHVLQVPSVGPIALRQLRVLCKHPADTFGTTSGPANPAMVVDKNGDDVNTRSVSHHEDEASSGRRIG